MTAPRATPATPRSDISDPAGNDQCMGAAMGQECTPYYMQGMAPPGYENVGACTLPI